MADRLAASRPARRGSLPANWPTMVAIMASSTMVGMTMSFSFPLLSLVLERRGVPADLIGLNSAGYGLAVFVVAPWLPRIVNRLGAVRSMAVGQLLCIACFLLLPLKIDLSLWFGLRFLLGLGTVITWVASESAINALAEDASRGRVIGFYATLFCVGYAAGPVLLGVIGSDGWLPFVLSAALLGVGLAPLTLARDVAQAMAEPGTSGLVQIWRLAPLALAASLTFGFVETASFAFLPLYGLRLGYDEAGATLLLALLIAGNILFQLPLGWLADRWPRPRVLLGCAVLCLVGLALWPLVMADRSLAWPLLVVLGGALGGFYTLSITLLGARFRGTDLAVANTAFVMMYQLGAIGGPALAGIAMSGLGAQGLPLVMALAIALFLGFGTFGLRAWAPPRRGPTPQGHA